MSIEKVNSSKNAVTNMLMYYYNALIESGCEDPKREIATTLSTIIGLSEAQSEFVQKKVQDNNVIKILEDLKVLTESINVKYDKKTIIVMTETITHLIDTLGGINNGNK